MTINLSKFSEKGLHPDARVDIGALSDRGKLVRIDIPVTLAAATGRTNTAYFVQNQNTDHNLTIFGLPGTLKHAMVASDRVPAGGTLAWQIMAATTDGTTKVALTDTANPEAVTANVGQALTLATTNAERAATDVLFLRCTADNSAVGTDARSVLVTLHIAPTEETTLTE